MCSFQKALCEFYRCCTQRTVTCCFHLTAIFYPISVHWSTTRGDTVIILGAGAGVHCASWLGNYYGFNWYEEVFVSILFELENEMV